MRKTKELHLGRKIITVMTSMLMALALLVMVDAFSIVSHAESQGKVVVASAKVRQEASTDSAVLGNVAQGSKVTVTGESTAADGAVWYKVVTSSGTEGYIRSDLLEIVEENGTPDNENIAGVTRVEPVSATVKGSQSVRVRSNASTGSQIVTMAQNGLALTVVGQTVGTDGKDWYHVNFISDGSEVSGFIRSDYVDLSGELVPATEADTTPDDTDVPVVEDEGTEQTPIVSKDWDTQYDDGKWYLVDYVGAGRYEIDNIFKTVENNGIAIAREQETVKSQKIVIILLVVVVIGLAGVVMWLSFKIRDAADSAYFAQIEREQARRNANRQKNGDKKVMHTVGGEKRSGGQRPVGAPAQGGQRPGGQRPVGAPAQGGQRPGGQRPVGAPGQGGQRPVGAPAQASVKKPEQGRPQTGGAPKQNTPNKDQNWQAKNFMAEEDEFEFEFLNWDGEDE